MRQPREFDTADGKRYRVRFRRGGVQTSETFRRKADALTFAAVLDGGGVADALAWLDARDRQQDSITFAEWFDQYVEQLTGVTVRTRADYRSQHRRYLSDLDDMPLPMISRTHVTSIVNELDRRGLSAKTIQNVMHMLSSSMALAIDEGHLTKNPCKRVRLPKPGLDVVDARFLTPEEFGTLYASVRLDYQPLVAFLAGTGLRWSEATALEARHVDLTKGTVRVEQAWKWQGKGKGYALGPPKSPKSRRTVNAAVLALAAVEPLLRKPGDTVFLTQTGQVVRHNNFFNRIWRPACEAAGFDPSPRIHDLRHTHASWLISDGQPLEAVQDQLGHESILTTRKVYGHLQPALGVALGRSASEALASALSNRVQPVALATGPLDAVESPRQLAQPAEPAADGGEASEDR